MLGRGARQKFSRHGGGHTYVLHPPPPEDTKISEAHQITHAANERVRETRACVTDSIDRLANDLFALIEREADLRFEFLCRRNETQERENFTRMLNGYFATVIIEEGRCQN